jgi:spermidine synthase
MESNILYQTKTPYNDIRVCEKFPIRKLLFGQGICQEQTAINLEKPHEHVFDFSLLAMHSLLYFGNVSPSRILVIGLGGGFIPMQMAHFLCNANIDVIEIDPEVVRIAKEYFNFKEDDRVKVYIGDAFGILDNLKDRYDIIVVDAFTTNYIPYHLMAREFYCKIFSLLKVNGVIAVNTCNVHPSYLSQVNTIYDVFGDNISYLQGSRNNMSTMLFVTKSYIDLIGLDHMRCHFFIISPIKLVITDEVRKAKVFTLNKMA